MDQYIRRRGLVPNGRSSIYLFLFISSFTGAWYAWTAHIRVCDLSNTYINISAFFQVMSLATKCLFDLDYLNTYGTLKVKIV